MNDELERALKRRILWFGSYKKSRELKKIPVWLILNHGQLEFLTPQDSYKVKRVRRNPRVICNVGTKEGLAIAGKAEIIRERGEIWRVYRGYWKTHPLSMALGIGLLVWIGILRGTRVVIRVMPDRPNPFLNESDPAESGEART